MALEDVTNMRPAVRRSVFLCSAHACASGTDEHLVLPTSSRLSTAGRPVSANSTDAVLCAGKSISTKQRV